MRSFWLLAVLLLVPGGAAAGKGGHKAPAHSPDPAAATVAPAAATLSGDITAARTLTGDTVIPDKATVKVSAGVALTLGPNATLTVLGSLVVTGSADRAARLSAEAPPPGARRVGAGRILVGKGGRVTLNYVVVEGLGSPGHGAIELQGKGAEVSVRHVSFQNLPGSALVAHQGRILGVWKSQFQNVEGSGIEVYGDKVGDLNLTGSSFEGCKRNALLTYRYQGLLTVEGCSFTGGGRYALFVDGDVEFHVRGNTFSGNKGAFACRRREMEARGRPAGRPTLSENRMDQNGVDTESDDWSQGNLIYLHGCTVTVNNNTITGSSKKSLDKKESKRLPNLINFFDSTVDMRFNNVSNNTKFLYILNIGGALTKLTLERNLLANGSPSGTRSFEIANEASGVRISAARNWWGCDDEDCVKSRILDFADGGEKYGVVDYNPFLTEPDMGQEPPEVDMTDDSDRYDAWDDMDGYFDEASGPPSTIIDKEVIWDRPQIVTESIWIKKEGALVIRVDELAPDNITISLGAGVNIHVDGALHILGSDSNFVRFVPLEEYPDKPPEPWGSITFSKGAADTKGAWPSAIQFAEFMNGGAAAPPKDSAAPAAAAAGRGASPLGMVILMGPNLTVSNSRFVGSASAGLVVAKGRVTVDHCTFRANEGNAVAHYAREALVVKWSTFVQNKKFPILLTQGTYNITDSSFLEGNVGVLCVRRRRNEDPTKLILGAAAVPTSELRNNRIIGNSYAPATDCWGETGEDTMLLLALAGKPVVIERNRIAENKCDSKAVRRRATIIFLTAEDVMSVSANVIEKNYGKVYLARQPVKVESWDYQPLPLYVEGNHIASNLFFSIFLHCPNRRAFVTGNVLENNEVSDESALKAQPLFEVLGGDFTRRPLSLKDNRIVNNEGTLLALRLHDLTVASGNAFANPFVKYELEFANPDPMGFTGMGNYWGEFDKNDGDEIAARIKPMNGKVPKRWYSHWVTKDGSKSEPDLQPPVVRPEDKASATLTFLVVVVLGFLIVLVVLTGLYCKGTGSYHMLEGEEMKASAE